MMHACTRAMGRRDTGSPDPHQSSVAAKLRIPLPVIVATRQRASVVQRRSLCIRLNVDGLRRWRANRCVVVLVVKWIRLDGTVGHLHVILVALGWHSSGSCSTSCVYVPIAILDINDNPNDDSERNKASHCATNNVGHTILAAFLFDKFCCRLHISAFVDIRRAR